MPWHHTDTGLIVLTLGIILIAAQLHADDTNSIVPGGAEVETLWTDGGFTEGAAAGPDGAIYFSDFLQPFSQGKSRVMRFDPETRKVSVHSANSRMANGLMFDAQGRLIACCACAYGGLNALAEIQSDGSLLPIVNKYQDKKFNSPNDIVIDSQGRIYFSDPKYVGPEKMELEHFSVYRYDPDQSLHRVTTDITKPNGVMLSPDEKTLYVAETDSGTDNPQAHPNAKPGRMTLNAFPVKTDGSLGKKQVIVDFGDQLGIDGMTVDKAGHIYAAVRSDQRNGIVVYQPDGTEVAYIKVPELPTNCVFGRGGDAKTLYITAGGGFYRIKLAIPGHHSVKFNEK